MANLKGSSFEKQANNIHHRLTAFGEKRHGRTDKKTHSSALAEKRNEMSKSFAKFCEEKGFEGKLNEHMTNENIKEFLDQRLEGLAPSTIENYTRAFSCMLEGLQQTNISISYDKSVFDEKVAEAKEMPLLDIEEGRAIDNADKLIEELYEERFESGVLADIQLELGLRVSEAYELASNPEKYINEADNLVEKIIGKGNHIYPNKDISNSLIQKIKEVDNLPSQRTYGNDLGVHGISSHDFRYTYAKNEVQNRLEQGYTYKQVMASVSEELNHSRPSMTQYYLNKA